MMYKKVDTTLNFAERELEVIDFWKKNDIFRKTIEQNEDKKPFTFYDGPPTANGKPHIGHVLTRAIKDIIPRYRTMKGQYVLRKAGWDTHGLPVELEVEKSLGLDGKKDIEGYGIEQFIYQCKQSVFKYQNEWRTMSDRVGYWADMDNPYITYDDKYIESVWWSLKQIYDKGLMYQGHKVVPYCPRCGTALSSHEVAQGYKTVNERSIIVEFQSADNADTYFLAWTTTPWTLPSNAALCVNPNEDYALIESNGKKFVLAKALVDKHFTEYTILSVKKGREYEGQKYHPIFDYVKQQHIDKAWFVTCGDFVTLTDGTGIVHIAPSYGEDDAEIGKNYKLPFIQLVDERGKFSPVATDFTGLFCKTADKKIIEHLKSLNKVFKDFPYEHKYPYCWRCDTALLYFSRKTWFIKMSEVKDRLVKLNQKINWMPPTIGEGRMGNFLENVIDWGISRERYWGTPLPLWICGSCGKVQAIGSKSELRHKANMREDIELHKPYVDRIKIECSCGEDMVRTPEVIDCWYDSGSMPFAQYHYPFENKSLFEQNFPAAFISEAVDQTRGWFYTLLAISTLIFDEPPFKNCIVLGHVCDENGVKMSKHKGNVVNTDLVLNTCGADAVRWHFYTANSPWLPSRFSVDAVSESQRKFLGTLWNTYSFFVLYSNIDGVDASKIKLKDCRLSEMDKWILSYLNSLIKQVDEGLCRYKITETSRAITEFTDALSNWYVRRSRERFWRSEFDDDKRAAYGTLYTVLTQLIKISAPFVPFITETIYQNLVRRNNPKSPESVHLCRFPLSDKSYINKKLENEMQTVLNITNLGRTARNESGIKNRQPLRSIMVASAESLQLSAGLIETLKGELNVKEVTIINDAADFIVYELKPQLKTLGPKYGALLKDIKALMTERPKEIIEEVRKNGVYSILLNNSRIELTEQDLLISVKSKEGFVAQSGGGLTVVLDTHITKALSNEGLLRELVSKIQTMRKEAGFEVTDHIEVSLWGDEAALEILKEFDLDIRSEVFADKLAYEKIGGGFTKAWDINGYAISVSVSRVKL